MNKSQVYKSDFWDPKNLTQIVDDLASRPDDNALSSATSFEEYVQGLVGPILSSSFYKKYPEKVWGIPTSEMLPDWAPKRLRICETQESFFKDQFLAFLIWLWSFFQLIEEYITQSGNEVILDNPVIGLSTSDTHITQIITPNNQYCLSKDDLVVSTLPISLLAKMLGFHYDIEFRGIASVYLSFESSKHALPDPYSWLYFSDQSIFNRITEPTKISPSMNQSDNANRKYLVCEHAFSPNQVTDMRSFKDYVLEKTLLDFKAIPMFSDIEITNSAINIEKYVYPHRLTKIFLLIVRCVLIYWLIKI